MDDSPESYADSLEGSELAREAQYALGDGGRFERLTGTGGEELFRKLDQSGKVIGTFTEETIRVGLAKEYEVKGFPEDRPQYTSGIKSKPRGGDGGTQPAPLQAYATGADTIKVKPGTADGVVVTASGGGALDAADVTVTDGYQLWLKVTLNEEGGTVTAAVMQNTDPGSDTETQASRLAVAIAIADGVMTINNYLSGSQDHDSCGTSHSFILS